MKIEVIKDIKEGGITIPAGTILECKDGESGFKYICETEDHFENGFSTIKNEWYISKEAALKNDSYFKTLDEKNPFSNVDRLKYEFEELKKDYNELYKDYKRVLDRKDILENMCHRLKKELEDSQKMGNYNMWDQFWSYIKD